MPYIPRKDREFISMLLDEYEIMEEGHLCDVMEDMKPGQFNYLLTVIVIEYVKAKGLSYTTCNEIVGVLSNVLHEFRRRVQDEYENQKMEENGDVYDVLWEDDE